VVLSAGRPVMKTGQPSSWTIRGRAVSREVVIAAIVFELADVVFNGRI
jgi:hypothetical protein